MTQIKSPQLARCAARPKEVRGGSRQSEAAEPHPGLKGGEEPKLVRQGKRSKIAQIGCGMYSSASALNRVMAPAMVVLTTVSQKEG